MSVLVTGADGFVGSHLVQCLPAEGQRVRACTRSLAHARLISADVEWAEIGDLASFDGWSPLLKGVSTVIHAAACAGVNGGRSIASSTLMGVNVAGTLRLANSAAAAGVRRFVFVSSIKVLGEETSPDVPFREDFRLNPVDNYAKSKAEAEKGLREISDRTGLEVVIVRPPMVYGAGLRGNFALLISLVRRGIPLPLATATGNRRSLIAVDNLVYFLSLCATRTAAANRTFHVKDGVDLSTVDLLTQIALSLGTRLRLFPFPEPLLRAGERIIARDGLVRRLFGNLQLDDGLARTVLGWHPVVSGDRALAEACRTPEGRRTARIGT